MFPALSSVKGALESPVTRWLLLVLVAGAAFSAGRFTGPVEVETRTEVKVVEKFVERSHEKKALVRTVYIERTPTDAGVVERISTREEEKSETARDTSRDVASSNTMVTATKSLSRYHLGLLLGYSVREPALRIGETNLVIGGTGGARLGDSPLFLDAWVIPQFTAGGVGLSGEFP